MNEKKFGLAVIGCGRWGINHVRTAHQLFKDKLVVAADANPSAKDRVSGISPSIGFTSDIESVFTDDRINSVIVATPAETHFTIARSLLEQGKNVLVEKPITLHPFEAEQLIRLSQSHGAKLMVGHVLLYHPAVLKLKEMVKAGKIGKLQYVYSNRLNFGTVRTEENILWSFAPHDISIIQYLTESNPISVYAAGASFLQPNLEDSTVTYLVYPNNVHAHIFVSWLHPFKEQRLVVIGDRGMIVFEDSAPKEKLKFYPKRFSNTNGMIEKFEGQFEVISHEEKQPLAEEHLHFYNSVVNNTRPLTDGVHALEILEILEKAERSLKNNAV